MFPGSGVAHTMILPIKLKSNLSLQYLFWTSDPARSCVSLFQSESKAGIVGGCWRYPSSEVLALLSPVGNLRVSIVKLNSISPNDNENLALASSYDPLIVGENCGSMIDVGCWESLK